MENIFAKIEAYLDKEPDLYLHTVKTFNSTNVMDAVLECLKLNSNYKTLFVKSDLIQCGHHRRRSIGDIYKIIKHYLPDARLEEIKKGLEYHCNDGNVGSLICPDIHKRVWRYNYIVGRFSSFNMDEFGLTYDIKNPSISIYYNPSEEKANLHMINL